MHIIYGLQKYSTRTNLTEDPEDTLDNYLSVTVTHTWLVPLLYEILCTLMDSFDFCLFFFININAIEY